MKYLSAWMLILLLALIWGSSFILMKKGLIGFPPEQIAGLRLAFACFALSPFHFIYYKKYKTLPWRFLIIVALAGNGIPAFLFAYAQTGLNSATAGILNSLTPVFTLLLGCLVFSQRLNLYHLAGVVLGLIGAVSLLASRVTNGFTLDFEYGGWIILATLLYAVSVNTLRHRLNTYPPLMVATLALSLAGIPAFFFLMGTDFFSRVTTPIGYSSVGYILILSFAGTAVSLILFNRLIQLSGALSATSVTYLMPVVALFWGLLDHEEINWSHGIGLGLILIGVWLVNYTSHAKAS
jgi:drug/metabolite transporter (DMT)-like permease